MNGKERAKEIIKVRKERKAIGKERKEIGGQTGKEKAMHPKATGKAERRRQSTAQFRNQMRLVPDQVQWRI